MEKKYGVGYGSGNLFDFIVRSRGTKRGWRTRGLGTEMKGQLVKGVQDWKLLCSLPGAEAKVRSTFPIANP